MRKVRPKNYVQGPVGPYHKTTHGLYVRQGQGALGPQGVPGQGKGEQQTDSPTASRPGFRLACQRGANYRLPFYQVDLKTAFLVGESYGNRRDIVRALPPEAGHPPHIGARVKKPAYGLNDAPLRWWDIIDGAIHKAGRVPPRAGCCSYVVHSDYIPKRAAHTSGRTGGTNSSKNTMETKDAAMPWITLSILYMVALPPRTQCVELSAYTLMIFS